MTAQIALESADHGTLLSGESKVLELIASGAPLSDALDALCRVIDEQSGLMSALFLLNREGDQLSLAAGPHLPAAWREATRAFRATPTTTACGAAVHQRRQVIVPDVSGSPLFTPWREAAIISGIGSVWSTPFFSKDGQVLGTFAVFAHESGDPGEAHLSLVARATHLASIAVERHVTERGLRESEVRFSTAFYANPVCMSITRFADGRFLYVNDAFVRMCGYSRAETIGQTALGLGLYADPAQRPILMQLLAQRQMRNVEVKTRTKSGAIVELVLSMERMELQGEESVFQIAIDITERKHAEEALRRSEHLLRLVMEAIPVGVAVLDPDGGIVLSNPASARIWAGVILGGPERYAASKGWWHDSGKRIEPDEWASVRAVTKGETSINEVIDIETFYGLRKIIQNSAVPIRDKDQAIVGAVVVNEDISARTAAEGALEASMSEMQTLATRLMHAQDDERRRIAQMLHETTAQDLAALKMLLSRLNRTCDQLSSADRDLLTEVADLADGSMTDIRTLSYLLHPPFLDETGLPLAVRWYTKGFADRSGIKIDLDLPETLERLPQDVETTLFRVIQEALINIYRHAQSRTAHIRLVIDGDRLTLEIQDHGRGMSSELVSRLAAGGGALGVGIASMRERLKQLAGTLEIESSDRGTLVRAFLPLPPQAS